MKILLKIEDTINRKLTGYLLIKINENLDLNVLTFDKDTKDESIIIVDLKNRNVFNEKDVITFVKYSRNILIDNKLLTSEDIDKMVSQYENKKIEEEEKKKRFEKFNQLTDYLLKEGYFDLYKEFKRGVNTSGLSIDMDIPTKRENLDNKEKKSNEIPSFENTMKNLEEKCNEKKESIDNKEKKSNEFPFFEDVMQKLKDEFGLKEENLKNIKIFDLNDILRNKH